MVDQVQSWIEYAPLRGAGESRDPRNEQWDWLRRRLAVRLPDKKLCIAELCRAYEETTGTSTGCD
jgi:hypothetical protein